MNDQRTTGAWMIAVAVVLAILALGLWSKGTTDAESDQRAEEFTAIFEERPADDVGPNRAGPLAVAGLAGVLFLGGVILISNAPPSPPPTVEEPDDPVPT